MDYKKNIKKNIFSIVLNLKDYGLLSLKRITIMTFQLKQWWMIKVLLVQMPGNCRNISDEVFPGIHVGDK